MPPRVARDRIRFEFVGFGEAAREVEEEQDRLWLDVGNELRVGVVDQHHLAAYLRSTTSLVLAHPDLVLGAVDAARSAGDPFTIVLHQQPDLDAVAATGLATALLTTGRLPPGAAELALYLDQVDQGSLGMSQDNPYSLYSAYMVIAHRLAQRSWRSPLDRWRKTVEEGLEVVEFVLEAVSSSEQSILDIDAFACPGLFGPPDRRLVEEDITRYRRKLADPAVQARAMTLRLPGQLGGTREVDALLVRDVQGPDDPERVLFFKDWARTDRSASPGEQGFAVLSVFESESPNGRRRCIVSVRPDSGTSLRGLGEALDRAEGEARRHAHGVDDRVEDPDTHEHKQPRQGYANSDPWYDGRAHTYTIVDAPRSGTRLTAEQVEDTLVSYGRRTIADASPLEVIAPAELSAAPEVDTGALRRLTAAVDALRSQTSVPPPPRNPPAVFISYPRTRLDWTRQHVYEPLRALFGDRVFFDLNSLEVGMDWLSELADAVHGCRVFLAVYCEDYFRSSFCQWELQLAVIRDPVANGKVLVPVEVEPVRLPSYCAHIQAHQVAGSEVDKEIARIVESALQRQPV